MAHHYSLAIRQAQGGQSNITGRAIRRQHNILETTWRHSFPESFLRACARLPECPTSYNIESWWWECRTARKGESLYVTISWCMACLPNFVKSSQVAFKKTSDNRTSFTSRLNENKIVKNQCTIKIMSQYTRKPCYRKDDRAIHPIMA